MKGKVLILTLCIILSLFSTAAAQVELGPMIGLNLANSAVEPDEAITDFNIRKGLILGGVIDFNMNDNVAIAVYPVFIMKGTDVDVEGSDLEFGMKFSYLEIAPLLKLKLPTENIKPYFLAGPSLGFLLSAKEIDEGDEDDVKDQFKNIDFSLNVGAGVNIPVSDNTIFIEFRYSFGLNNIIDDPEDDEEAKTRGIQFMAGIKFPIGGN